MNARRNWRWAILDTLFAFAGLSLFVYVFFGFFYTAPQLGPVRTFCLWIARIGTVVIAASAAGLYYGIRKRCISPASAVLLVGSLALCALVAYPILSHFDPNRHFRQEMRLFHPYLQLSPNDYRERATQSATPALKVFCLGGSTTEFTDGYRQNKKGRGWPERLEDRLHGSVPGHQILVYNLGRTWYTTMHTLINYEVNLRHHRPDVIIVMHGINDLIQNADFCQFSVGGFREDYRHFLGPVSRLIKRQSTWTTIRGKARSLWYYQPPAVIDTDHFPGLLSFERNLRTLIQLARADGTTVVLMTQPYLFKDSMTPAEEAALAFVFRDAVGGNKRWSTSTAKRGMEQYTDTVRRLARETNVYLVDLERVVPKTLEYFWDEVHYEDKTFDIIADHIAKQLLELHVLHETPSSSQ